MDFQPAQDLLDYRHGSSGYEKPIQRDFEKFKGYIQLRDEHPQCQADVQKALGTSHVKLSFTIGKSAFWHHLFRFMSFWFNSVELWEINGGAFSSIHIVSLFGVQYAIKVYYTRDAANRSGIIWNLANPQNRPRSLLETITAAHVIDHESGFVLEADILPLAKCTFEDHLRLLEKHERGDASIHFLNVMLEAAIYLRLYGLIHTDYKLDNSLVVELASGRSAFFISDLTNVRPITRDYDNFDRYTMHFCFKSALDLSYDPGEEPAGYTRLRQLLGDPSVSLDQEASKFVAPATLLTTGYDAPTQTKTSFWAQVCRYVPPVDSPPMPITFYASGANPVASSSSSSSSAESRTEFEDEDSNDVGEGSLSPIPKYRPSDRKRATGRPDGKSRDEDMSYKQQSKIGKEIEVLEKHLEDHVDPRNPPKAPASHGTWITENDLPEHISLVDCFSMNKDLPCVFDDLDLTQPASQFWFAKVSALPSDKRAHVKKAVLLLKKMLVGPTKPAPLAGYARLPICNADGPTREEVKNVVAVVDQSVKKRPASAYPLITCIRHCLEAILFGLTGRIHKIRFGQSRPDETGQVAFLIQAVKLYDAVNRYWLIKMTPHLDDLIKTACGAANG